MSASFRLGTVWLCLTAGAGFAGGETNRYSTIAQRNSFGLRAPSAAIISPPTTTVSQVKIKLVGLAAVAPYKWAVLQIQAPGKPQTTLALKEGCGEGAVEILEVDAKTQRVKVRNAGSVMTVMFEDEALTQKNALTRLQAEHQPLTLVPPPGAGDP